MVGAPDQIIQPQIRRKRRRSWRQESSPAPHPRLALAPWLKILKAGGIVSVVILMWLASEPIASSSLFILKEVNVAGNTRLPTDQAEQIVREVMGGNVFAAELAEVREALRRQPLVKDAVVTRILPDTVRVTLMERDPVAVVALSTGKLICVDAEGIILGDFELMGAQPPLLGWDERTSPLSQSANRRRVQQYMELRQALSEPDLNFWNQIDRVDIRNLSDVVISLTHNPTTEIHIGNREFDQRFRQILRILDEVMKGQLQVSYIDVSDPSRVVIRPPKRSEDAPSASRSPR